MNTFIWKIKQMYIKITFNCKKNNIKNNHKRYKISKQCHLQIAKGRLPLIFSEQIGGQ